MAVQDYQAWVGRERRREANVDVFGPQFLAAILERQTPQDLPPVWHWTCFPDSVPQSQVGPDGHPRRGDFLPAIDLPRRMFAAAKMTFEAPLRVNRPAVLIERIASVEPKTGRTGPLVFLNVDRRVEQDGRLCTAETQTIVYRDAGSSPAAAPPARDPGLPAAEWRLSMPTDPVALFRFSAATANGHRIHYDKPYAIGEEGYPGLVVHGPYLAIALAEGVGRASAGRRMTAFSFRALSPLFDGQPLLACGRLDGAGAELWAEGPGGAVMMTARAEFTD